MRKAAWFLAGGVAAAAALLLAQETGVFAVISSVARPGRQPGGAWLIPTNQLLLPARRMQPVRGRPVDIALDPRGRSLAVLNMDTVEFYGLTAGDLLAAVKSRPTSYSGIAFAPDGSELWASEAKEDGRESLLILTLNERGLPESRDRIELEGHPVPVGIAFPEDGSKAFVALSRLNALAVFDRKIRKLERQVPVGVAPHGVAVDSRHSQVFVTNRAGSAAPQGVPAVPSAGTLVATDPRTGSASTGSVTMVSLKTWETREIATGLAPSGLAVSPDGRTLAVANGHSDSVSLIDTSMLTARELKVPAWPEGTFGSQPDSVAWSPGGKLLYVACGGTNSVAVFRGGKFTGALPSSWFPSALAVEPGGALHVAGIKGVGSTANGDGTYASLSYQGSLQRIAPPSPAVLEAGLREVKAANMPRFTPAGGVENLRSLGIRHVFLIIKENRTYDQVFGDIAKGNGDPKLVMYGASVTPNQHALAERYVLLDNLHSTGAISFDGHHWLMMAFVSDYTQRAFAGSPRGYAWDMSDPLTLSPKGFFWMGAPGWVKTRSYGEFCQPAKWNAAKRRAEPLQEADGLRWNDFWRAYTEDRWQEMVGCASGVPALHAIMSPRFPGFDNRIADQVRAGEFLREFRERDAAGTVAEINIIALNADHTAGTTPGYPTPRAMVADNDWAVGRIVEGISKSRVWKESLILAIEDDSQDGLDHVDGHRTVGLMVGPNVRRGAVDSNYYSQLSMIRTIQEIFQIPPRTAFLQNSRPMTSVFTPEADPSEYEAVPARIPLDEMNPPLKTLQGRQAWAARESAAMNWKDVDDVPTAKLNRILWWDAKGWSTPYPAAGK